METPRFAVVLSGCGVFDGSEIHEAVCALLAIDEAGCAYQCFAPNTWQAKTVDHFTGEASAIAGDADNRNVLAESARIARGNILDLSEFNPKDFDAIIFPGGFGAAMNWSNFAVRGPACEVNEEVERALNASYEAGIVIGAMCIAPTVVARVLGKHKVKVTGLAMTRPLPPALPKWAPFIRTAARPKSVSTRKTKSLPFPPIC